jgi:hypothetical protein
MSVRLPTRRADWRLLGRTARLVLTIPTYAALALLTAALALSLFVFSQNIALVSFALGGTVPFADSLTILLERYPFVGTDYGPLSGGALLAVSLLTGANVALVGYHLREHGLSLEGGGGSALGVALGVLGAGCAACGSAVLAGLLSLFGAAGLLTALPLEGVELSLLAAVVLVLSMYWLADGMRGGEINGCPVDVS